MWSDTVAELPETYDEQKAREDFDKRGVTDERALMAMALAKMTGLDLPETLAARVTGRKAHIPLPEMVNCADGHPNLPGAKFCGECGQPVAGVPANGPGTHFATTMRLAAEATAAPPAEPPPPAPPAVQNGSSAPPVPSLPSNTKMRGMKREDLTALAAGAGVATGGSRQDVLDRLIAVNNTAKETTGGV